MAAYELWNESDNTWKSANGTYEDFWTKTFRQVRSLDPNKPIQGPSFSDNISDMRNFLQNAKNTNTVPDIIAWHELIRSSKIAGDVATVNGILDTLGISRRPIAIEEYAAPSEVGLPGPLVGYISKFERLGIRDAELAFWNQSGTLGDLLTSRGGSPNAAYWLYTWYGAMSGNMVSTTPPAQTGIDGFAAVPSRQEPAQRRRRRLQRVVRGAGQRPELPEPRLHRERQGGADEVARPDGGLVRHQHDLERDVHAVERVDQRADQHGDQRRLPHHGHPG